MAVKNRKYTTRSPKAKKTTYQHRPTRTSPYQTNTTLKSEEEMMMMVKQITFQP